MIKKTEIKRAICFGCWLNAGVNFIHRAWCGGDRLVELMRILLSVARIPDEKWGEGGQEPAFCI